MHSFYKNIFISILVILLSFSIGRAQINPTIDSISKIIRQTSDEKTKVDLFCKLAKEYINVDIKKANEYTNRAIALSSRINYTHGQLEGANLLSMLDIGQGRYSAALLKLKDALDLAEKTHDDNAIAKCFLSIGDIYTLLKNNGNAIENYEKAYDLFSKNGDQDKCITSLNRIGNRTMDIGNVLSDTSYFFKAIKIYSKAFVIANTIHDNIKIINSYVNLADAYNILGVKTQNNSYFFHSLDYSLHGLSLARESNNINYEGLNFINIGDSYDKLKLYSKAIHFYEAALQKYEQIGDKGWMQNTYSYLSKSYYSLKNYDRAIYYTKKSIDISKEQKLFFYLRDNYALLSEIYSAKKDFEKALEYYKLSAQYKDSLINENSAIKIASLQTEFEFTKKNQEIQLLKKNTEIQEHNIQVKTIQGNLLIAGILIVFILLIIIYYRYLENNKVQKEIIRAKETAEHAKDLQEQFLANTSHEIRTPMNGIIGMTNHLKDTTLSNDQMEYIGAINESANSLLVLINDLLDLSKINAGKMTFEKKPFKISDLFKNLIYSLHYRSVEKNIHLISTIDEKIPSILVGDAIRLNQILLNLTGNAIKFTEKGEVKIVAKLLKDDGKDLLILFSVHDTGIGIHENKINTIFESFTQVNAKTTRKYGGTGLGLTIAKQLIEQQGGTISVSSKVNEGSTFTFTLSFKKQLKHQKDNREIINFKLDNNQPNLYSITVLVVDDNKVNQRVAALTLQKWNAKVEVADNAISAYKKLITNKYDLVLMDVTMPEIDGFEATRHIRKKMPSSISNIPIIAMTASAFTGDREKCIAVGMNEYISKPFHPEELYGKMVKVISESSYKNSSTIDLKTLIDRSEGDKEYLTAIINSYIQEMPIYTAEMNQFLNNSNHNAIRQQAHKMKSPAKLLGAFELNQQLEFIEMNIAEIGLSENMIKKVEHVNNLSLQTVDELKKELKKMV